MRDAAIVYDTVRRQGSCLYCEVSFALLEDSAPVVDVDVRVRQRCYRGADL